MARAISYINNNNNDSTDIYTGLIEAVTKDAINSVESKYAGLVNTNFSESSMSGSLNPATAVLSVLISFSDGTGYWINNLDGVTNSLSTNVAKSTLEAVTIPFKAHIPSPYTFMSSGFGAEDDTVHITAGSGIFNLDFTKKSLPLRTNTDDYISNFKQKAAYWSDHYNYIAKGWSRSSVGLSANSSGSTFGENGRWFDAEGYNAWTYAYFNINFYNDSTSGEKGSWASVANKWLTDSVDSFIPDPVTQASSVVLRKYPIVVPNRFLLGSDGKPKTITRLNIYIQHKGSFFRYMPLAYIPLDLYHRDGTTKANFRLNAYGVAGLTKLTSKSATSSTMSSPVTSGAVQPYTLTKTRTFKIPDIKWDFLNSNHILNYWSQMVYYGFSSTLDSDGNYLPTNYIGVSDIEEPTYLPATKLLDVFTKDNAPITTAIPWRDNLVVFTPTTTSMFVGRVPQSQQLINANVGIPDKYRKTAQVVSNSIVFKNEGDVFALVPSAGTDEAESLTVRNISKQISALIKEVETETISNSAGLTALSPSADYHISSMTFNNDEYWLIYGSKKLNKTTIFKYSWSKFCWIMDEYQIYLDDFIKTNEHMIVATDKNGLVYELLSDHKNETASDLASSIDFSKTALTELENLYKTIPNITPQAIELLEAFINLFRYYIGNIDLINSNGTETVSVDFHPIEMLSEDLIKKLRTDIPELVDNEVILQSIELLLNSINNIYGGVPIDFKLVLGARKPMLDTHTMIDELTVAIGTDGKTRSEDQIKATVYTDRLKFTEMNLVSENDSKVISTSVPNVNDLTMSIGNSLYERPAATKKTKKVMKMADAVDVAIEGSVISPVYIDGISISYRQTGRKKF